MAEWVHTNDGTPLKTSDAMLDELYTCYALIARIEAEKAELQTALNWYKNRISEPNNVRL